MKEERKFSFYFCEESGIVLCHVGHNPVFKLSDLMIMKNLIDRSIEKYLDDGISDEMVDKENFEHSESIRINLGMKRKSK